MTQDDTLKMAREAGAAVDVLAMGRHDGTLFSKVDLGRFAALVAAKEREACAQVCESWADEHDYAAAIRSRSTT